MKIFQVIFNLTSGGAERVVVNLSNELCKNHEVVLVCFEKIEGKNAFYIGQISKKIRVISFNQTKGITLSSFLNFHNLIKQEQPNVVHAHLNTLLFCYLPSFIFYKKIKFFHTIHNVANKELGFFWQKKLNKFFYSKYIFPIAISKICAQSFSEFYNLNEIITINNSVPSQHKTKFFNETLKKIESLKRANDTIVFLNVARINPQKNHKMLINSFKDLINDGFDVILIIIGRVDDEYGKFIEDINFPGIYFLGEKNNVTDYINISDCFVLSSLWEGLPMTLLETISCGKPIVSTPIGGVPELILNEKMGVLSDSISKESFIKALKLFIEKGKENYDSHLIKNFFNENYSISSAVSKHINIYSK